MDKICFFTSSLQASIENEEGKFPIRILNDNSFLDRLAKHWKVNSKVLMISSDPDAHEINDFYRDIYLESFKLSDLSYEIIDIYDSRYEPNINEYDVLILAGGHTPTQNKYFHKIGLKNSISNYSGIIISISAGSMNAADIVYAHPELDGEASNPDYKKYLEGLGLFNQRILPHFQDAREMILDGYHLINDIAIPDSYKHDFYALNDGVYFYQIHNELYLCGKALYFDKGTIVEVGEENKLVRI